MTMTVEELINYLLTARMKTNENTQVYVTFKDVQVQIENIHIQKINNKSSIQITMNINEKVEYVFSQILKKKEKMKPVQNS
ncbi:hypothetical protein MBAV_001110 [Candidatus Magnetobacterium bavaricum]|uniref:Uncharacterized protein n=1 Tax=Candidatus Magnetobacterium bavaricum TaxID=29290 RepID=A0A0F3GXU6_9BACT|nr:hypothetical protein MBAV_001110 [Candidatus Magnetobacterium bavaricum]